jgi:hypothetical protein
MKLGSRTLEDLEYKLSLGRVMENGTIDIDQDMVNPFTYTLFL